MHEKSLLTLHEDLIAGKYSSVELTQYFLQRIKDKQELYNSFITVCEKEALDAARAADQKIAHGEVTVLTGIPMAHKDNFCTLGIKTSCASKMLDNFVAPYDATVVAKLKQAGAVLLGKTNMDEFSMGSSNETSFYGAVKNPWDVTRVPGGSSGGSAAAVAARLVPIATGTDSGGSIRQPAAWCGVVGVKPTYGLVSRFGIAAFSSSLDQAGPIARTAEDAAILLQQMVGFDSNDSTSIAREAVDYLAELNKPLPNLRIGLPKEFFGAGLDHGVALAIDEALTMLEKSGCKLVDMSLPKLELSLPTYYVLAPAECSSNLARYDGVRYGYRCEAPRDLEDLYKRTRGEGFGAEAKRRILLGTYVLFEGHRAQYYLKAQKLRRLIAEEFAEAFKNVDVILSPTTPTVAFKLGEKNHDPISMYLADMYTIAANLTGLPALTVPVGFCENLPVGMQVIGNYFTEALLLNVAHCYQKMVGVTE